MMSSVFSGEFATATNSNNNNNNNIFYDTITFTIIDDASFKVTGV